MTVSGSSAAGNAAWTWSDGTDSCNGTMDITASRDWGVAEGSRNSRPGIADSLTFADDVAFVTGSAVSLQDNDYFSFAPDADGVVQAELSHFDLQTSDLDLEILDANFNQIASIALRWLRPKSWRVKRITSVSFLEVEWSSVYRRNFGI
ncbi:MAG: hypothetical protein HOI35_00380 [Woeseia sp.]|jgi:hypothetical protein|nr:hypothetical protein [Woeseia sp.]MBT6208463.1 hypothetical protein [Woeseia sp.]